MKELKLPKGKMSFPPAPIIGMDDYLEFTEWNLKHTVSKQVLKERWEKDSKRIRFHF